MEKENSASDFPVNMFDYDIYLHYLESKAWAEIRNRRLEVDDYKCAICGNTRNLQVHHLIYPYILGTESINHLVTLCEQCHKDIENRKKSTYKKPSAYGYYSCAEIWFQFEDMEEYISKEKELDKYLIDIYSDERAYSIGHHVKYYLKKEQRKKENPSKRMTLVNARKCSREMSLNMAIKTYGGDY